MARQPQSSDETLFTIQLSKATAEKITVTATMIKSVIEVLAALAVLYTVLHVAFG